LGPVLKLNAHLDSSSNTRVRVSWTAPSYVVQHYVVTAVPKGVNCPVLPTRSLTSSTSLYLHLPCGNVYTITVRAVTNNGSSAAKQTFISIPSQIGAVRNLAVKFIPGNNATRNNATGLIKQREGGFLLTWEPPAHVKAADVKSYEVVVLTDSTLECVNRSETTATKWHIKREDNLEKLVDGRKYLFQVRCKTGCGFGAAEAKYGFYPDLPSPPTPSQISPSPAEPSRFPVAISSTTRTTSSSDKPSSFTVFTAMPKTSGNSSIARHTSPSKAISSFPRQGHQKDKSFPYWSIPVASGGIILIFIVFYLVRKYKRRIKNKRLVANLPHCPQDYTENSEDEMPLMLDHLTDDEMLITA